MTRRYDEFTFRRRLRGVLTADGLWSRMLNRGALWSGIEPPVVVIFGGTPTGYDLLWTASFLASIFLLGVLSCYLPGQMVPGYALALPFLVLFAWPVNAIVARKRAVKRCRPTDAAGFVTGVRGVDPEVPESFIMAAREALAAAYCVRVELIGHGDTRRRVMALSSLKQPLALEVIADICQREGIMWNYERMYAAARPFKTLRPANVAELVQMLHREMRSAQVL